MGSFPMAMLCNQRVYLLEDLKQKSLGLFLNFEGMINYEDGDTCDSDYDLKHKCHASSIR